VGKPLESAQIVRSSTLKERDDLVDGTSAASGRLPRANRLDRSREASNAR
jgi:hypothetical protein